MHVRISGPAEGRPVLLLHGGGVGGWMWDEARGLLEDAFRVIVPDLPGHDRSADASYVSHAQTVAELVRIIEEQAETPVAVIGFSLGAQLAVILAAEHPELVDAVVVVSAQAEPLRFAKATLALLSLTAPLAKRESFARAQAKELFISDELMADYLRTSAAITRETLLASVGENIRFVQPSGWSSFPGRVLILVGERERALMHRSAEYLQAELSGSELEVIDGCGHGIPLQRPEWFSERVRGFLSA